MHRYVVSIVVNRRRGLDKVKKLVTFPPHQCILPIPIRIHCNVYKFVGKLVRYMHTYIRTLHLNGYTICTTTFCFLSLCHFLDHATVSR